MRFIMWVFVGLLLVGCSSPSGLKVGQGVYLSALDVAIIHAGCVATQGFSEKVQEDDDCPRWIRDGVRFQALKAEVLDRRLGGKPFPPGAKEDAKE